MVSPVDNHLSRVLSALCHSADTPRALTVEILRRHGEWVQLLSLATDPRHYLANQASKLRKDVAVSEFLRKCRFDLLKAPSQREEVAITGFFESERKCAQTNRRFKNLLSGFYPESDDAWALPFLDKARGFVAKVLGRLPDSLEGRFGPGATFGDRGRLTTIPDKITTGIQLTPGASCLEPLLRGTAWYRESCLLNQRTGPISFSRGNRFTTVPKDWKKDRGICIEPSGNVFLQLGVGSLLKNRLQRFGLDLTRAQDRHKIWVAEASRTGSHATIDLSSASDTVATSLVKLLLPSDWYELLTALRSPATLIKGKWVVLEKFSSMGNGYTFELETLVFASLAYACGGGVLGVDFSVYGDDIIVPTAVASDTLRLLDYCGFIPNQDKTFVDGYFRESCGSDFFNGEPVRAHHVKSQPTAPEEWTALANGLRRLALRDNRDAWRWSFPYTAWLRCLDVIPSAIRRLRGPDELGDLVINDDDHTQWGVRVKSCIRYFRVYRPVAKPLAWTHFRSGVILAAALYGCPSRGVIPRGGVSGYRVGWVAYS